ncbi:kinase suppressor of Ras 2-like isoform X1 [Octopus sinensis]|uniref:non-specific serine/threonine protein kinase n=1 Tax=Octopus sinensis TaxID=2607531 RepID=A0A6P7TID1_9MOLL|nr:kinase suppressor of Ras 2-like isoform X1 [Octopus sinensis]
MSCESGQEWSVEHAIQTCSTVQSMIDFTAKHLYGLRTQCAPNEQITQKEIRDTESKLIKLFSQQLVIKAKLANDQRLAEFPKIEKWLNIFGINEQAISVIVNKGILLTSLLKMNEEQVRSLFRDNNAEKEAIQELTTALKHLNAWTDKQIKGDSCDENDVELHWTRYTPSQSSSVANSSSNTEAADGEGNSNGGEGTAGSGANEGGSGNSRGISSTSTTGGGGGGGGGSSGGGGGGGGGLGSGSGGGGGVDTGSPKYISCPSTSSLPSESFQPVHIPTSPQSTPSSPVPRNPKERHRGTPPPTPTLVRAKPMGSKYPSTPPPKKKIQLFPDASSLKKSRSCESQLASRVTNIDPVRQKKKPGNSKIGGSFEIINRRPSTEGSEAGGNSQGPSPVLSPAMRSPPYKADPNSLKEYHKTNTLPVPKSPLAPDQTIMVSTNHRFIIKPMFEICDYCGKHVLFGKICKDCRYKCHRDCANRAPNTCSLRLKYGSPKNTRRSIIKLVKSVPTLQRQDSGSNTSSCNSSTPSSPALPITSPASITSPSPAASPKVVPLPSQFPFPDVVDGVIDPHLSKNLDYSQDIDVNTTTSDDSDRTLVPSIEDKTLLDRVDSSELAPEDSSEHSWTRQHSLSVQLKEWNIPFEDITIGDRIGIGRFGIVHKGHWHGDVAIKKLNIDPTSDFQAQLSAFKLEVAMLKKTRHENLVLFMGACMKPPDLAIVTSFCKGKSLFSSIYEFRQKFQFSKTVYIATQIAQGMGYLHARGIIHKDLKTKNIFWEETGKVVITDFGLFNLTKWCHGNRKGDCLAIPLGWLCYLSPEIMRSLQAGNTQAANTELPFSKKSDTYAFGTVWYELLCGEWPFKQQPPESIIWQVGRGIKQSLCHIITSRDVKDILMDCWGFDPKDRPEFSQIPRALARIPRKPLIRSPSHPVHLSRSVDSVYVA